MMTVTQAERLVRKITEVIGQPPSDTQAKLAQEYADLCRAASRRLEQCALMIEAGQFLQALQLAETPPPLLDIISLLSFRQAAEWRAYCQSHQLPWSEPFYDKFVRQLNSAYGKGIASDHPFYRDYRRAVLKNDDERGLSILRVIARMNPADENTKEELKRVEEKLLRVKLEKLRDVLALGNHDAIQEQLSQIEASGAAIPASHPIWQQAQVARCQEMLRRAQALREQDAWREAEALVDEIHTLATHYNVQLPAADADAWTALEEWTSSKRGAYADDKDFERAVSALEYELQTIEPKCVKGARLGPAEVNAKLTSLASKWNEAGRFDRPLDEDLVSRRLDVQDWLQRQAQAAKSRSRLVMIVVIVVVLGAIGASIPPLMNWFGERDFAQRLKKLESERRVQDAVAMVEHVPARLSSKPSAMAAVAEAKQFIARENELEQTFINDLIGLQKSADQDFHDSLGPITPRRVQAERALADVAPEFQAAGKRSLQEWDAKWQAFRNAALGKQLDRAENMAVQLNGTIGYDAVQATLPRLRSIFAEMTPLESEPPELDRTIQTRIRQVTATAALWTTNSQRWQQAQAALAGAQSLGEYLTRLAQLVQSPFATTAQREGVDEIDRLKISGETLLGELLLPNNRPSWDALTNAAAWRATLMPEQPTAHEKDLYFKLRDDKNMQNVYVYNLRATVRPNNGSHSHLVFVQGAIAPDRAGQMAGLVYDPEIFNDTSRFIPTAYSDWDFSEITKSNRTAECETFERIGLGDLIDPNTGNYQKPVFQLLDQLNRDDNASPLFRAVVALKLFGLAQLRPDDWGWQWCPAAARELQALKDLGALDLKSGDWMVRVPAAKYEAPLQNYFAKARLVPLEKEARLLEQLAQQTCQTDFTYAGFIDIDGRPMLRHLTMPVAEYWGWSGGSESAVLLLRKTPGANGLVKVTDPLPLTPLFIFNGERRQLLDDTLRDTSYPRGQTADILPPFFSAPYE